MSKTLSTKYYQEIKKNYNKKLAKDIKIFLKKKKRLCIFLPKVSACRKDFNETKYIFLLINDDKLLEKCNKIWEKVKNIIKKEFDSEPVYNEKYLKAKIKSYKISNFD